MRAINFCLMMLLTAFAIAAHAEERDLFADTWVGTDALGRAMPTADEVGPPKGGQRRTVGMFYITWHSDSLAGMKSPYGADLSKILATDPAARLDAKHPLWTEGSFHWGEPELGYFLSKDEYVIRKDMSMLIDAGVDVLVMDVTNAVRYWDEWDTVFPVMQKMKAEGNRVPQFCFWAFNGPCITVVQDLYERIYKEPKYQDLWFSWDGKPLLLMNGNPSVDANGAGIKNPNPHYDAAAKTDPQHPHFGDPAFAEEFYTDYTPEVRAFFTLRTMWWGYYEWAGKRFIGTEDNWSFGYDMGDKKVQALPVESLVSTHADAREEAAVTPGQHPSSLTGKSWSRATGEPELNEQDLPKQTLVPWLGKTVEHPEGYGIYFQERWDEALKVDPQFLYINDWNEWTAGKYQPGEGKTTKFMRRDSPYFFVDQYNGEFNRSIQPMKGGYTDNYYMQMAQNIRRYKGARPIPQLKGTQEIAIDGDVADWAAVSTEYRDTAGDVFHRNYKGYGGLVYTNDSGRNDIVTCKVAMGKEQVYFYAECTAPLSPSTDPNWMLLLVDADKNAGTGWYGYDFLVNKQIADDKTTVLMAYKNDAWREVSRTPYRAAGRAVELSIPREILGLSGASAQFDYHWCDNPAELDTPIALCTNGDSAPNRRFNYRAIWSE